MKHLLTGILICAGLALSSGVGYASNTPTHEKAAISCDVGLHYDVATLSIDNGFEFAEYATVNESALAVNQESVEQTTPVTSDPAPVPPDKTDQQILDAANALNIPVDTVKSVDEIIDKGVYYVQNPPPKGATVGEWIRYVAEFIGLALGAYFFVKYQKVKPKK